ncbi:ATP-grasp domain-containing protein [Methanocaldococcus sp.]
MILFFEYALATNCREFIKEGKMMFDKLLIDFLKMDEVLTILDKGLFKEYKKFDNLNIIKCNGKLESIIKDLDNIDYFLVIAPEEDNILYNLTKILEDKGINLGSSPEGIRIAGDKYLTYKVLKDYVRVPKLIPLGKYVVKKRDGCGGKINIFDENYIVQEFVRGESLSASFIVNKNKTYFLSLNRQYIDDGFKGADVNIDHKLKDRIIEECERAIKRIEGLNGYIGVDLIVNNEDIYIIEINPRITTTVYGLEINPSLPNLLIKNAKNEELKYSVRGKSFMVK